MYSNFDIVHITGDYYLIDRRDVDEHSNPVKLTDEQVEEWAELAERNLRSEEDLLRRFKSQL
jgi:hypothetical protein